MFQINNNLLKDKIIKSSVTEYRGAHSSGIFTSHYVIFTHFKTMSESEVRKEMQHYPDKCSKFSFCANNSTT